MFISHVSGRRATSLNGAWHAIVDPYDRGEGQGFASNRKPESPSELVEYAFDTSDTLEVPGDWNTQREQLFLYEGVVWYQRYFELDAGVLGPPDGRWFLHFGAAHHRAKVWLNGAPVGEHVGGFTPFAFEVSEAIRPGRNDVVVKVDGALGDDDVPTRLTDWKHYGGLTRDVQLLELPGTFIESYFLQLAPDAPDRIRGWVQLDGPRARQEVRVVLPELGVEHAAMTDENGRAALDFPAHPERWSPSQPRLYTVELSADTDQLHDQIGFRTVERRGPDILLNGEPVFLRGISLHEESLLHAGRAHSQADAEASLALARELGANFVRLAHYPHDEYTVRAADRLGVLVWAEIPLYWGIAWENEATLAAARAQLSELIERDRNRAAVVLWSISNETPPTDARTAFLSALIAHVRALDDSRLVTSALFGGLGNLLRELRAFVERRRAGESAEPLEIVLDDPIADQLDVVGWNEYLGWYYSAFLARAAEIPESEFREIVLEGMPEFRIEVPSGKPLIVSEFGAGAKQGRHGGELEIWTEEYQARVYRQQLRMLRNAPTWRGLSPWILKDFRTPLRFLPGIQDGWNRKGLVSETGEKKAAFAVLREFYRELALG